MGVKAVHPEYKKRQTQWKRVRDVLEGSDAVKAAGKTYLPMLGGQSVEEYTAYKDRALFYSAAGRSRDGLAGMLTRKLPQLDYPEEMASFFKDVSGNNTSFNELFTFTANEELSVGRYGILIDWPTNGGEPYLATYETESIINWFKDENDILTGVVLQEDTLALASDGFTWEPVIQYRHLYIGADGKYHQQLYNDKEKEVGTEITPVVRGSAIDIIPMAIITTSGMNQAPMKPPIMDIVDVNLSMYRTSADLEHGRHFTALPTPVIIGAPADTVLKIGSQTAWAIPNEKAKVLYLEFMGQGLVSLERAMAEKTGQMAQFSSRLMDTSTRGSEAAETVRLRYSSEAATLSGIAVAVESAYNWLFNLVRQFKNIDGEVSIVLNKDFLNTRITASDLREMTEAYITGAMDKETYFYNLERGELVPEGKKTFDSEPVDLKSKDGIDERDLDRPTKEDEESKV